MTFSPEFEKALHAVANMGCSEPPFDVGQPLYMTNSPDTTAYIPFTFIRSGLLWWADCKADDDCLGPTYCIPCDWLSDIAPGEDGSLIRRSRFRVIDGGLA